MAVVLEASAAPQAGPPLTDDILWLVGTCAAGGLLHVRPVLL